MPGLILLDLKTKNIYVQRIKKKKKKTDYFMCLARKKQNIFTSEVFINSRRIVLRIRNVSNVDLPT